MCRAAILLVFVSLLTCACGSEPVPSPTPGAPTSALAADQPTAAPTVEAPTENLPSPTAEQATATIANPTETAAQPTTTAPVEATEPEEFPGLPLPVERGELFSASGACSICHTQMSDESGADVSTDTFWRSSMMANAARDPYWRASVEGEVLSSPKLRAAIEDKCATCHMPMARFTIAVADGDSAILENGFADPSHNLHSLAIDGVSCTLCHQIEEEGFGETASYSGGFTINARLPTGERLTYGPHPVEPDLAQLMQASSGFVPVESGHVEMSELCATCHTLYTPYVDANGEIAGEFPEQMAYFEWLASSFGGAIACQTCHMPQASGGVQLSITGGPPRSPFHQHDFAGGNAYMLEILKKFGPEMEVTASSAQFGKKQQQVLEQLQNRAAAIAIDEIAIDGSNLVADVYITISAGHKFPTGFPSRRAWIHFVVQDSAGKTVFESGSAAADGSIVGNDNDEDPATYEPHYTSITDAGQVQTYESIMGNTEGEVTTTLLRGAEYLKDNRLLPSGFDKNSVEPDISVRGAALDDEDFSGGSDRVHFNVALEEAQGPFTVTAELLYQSIGYRWAENLRGIDGQEVNSFLTYYDAVANWPVVVASDSVVAGE